VHGGKVTGGWTKCDQISRMKLLSPVLVAKKCDQIGQLCASWAIVYLGQCFKYRSSPNY
jgi:hypothetical protein